MADPDYFTLAELNALPNMTEAKYTEARKLAAAAYITSIIEREVGTSFVPRTVTETVDGSGSGSLLVDEAYIVDVTEITVDGVGVDVDLVETRANRIRFKALGSTWTPGRSNVVVEYRKGYSSEPPADVKEQAIIATRWHLLATNSNAEMDARRTKMTNDQGGTTEYAIAGRDRPTGFPTVDAMIVAWREKLDVFGFA